MPAPSPSRSVRLPVVLTLWSLAVTFGTYALARYAATEGTPAAASHDWPGGLPLDLAPSGQTLMMFVHSQCPCSRASLTELDGMVARAAGPVTAYVVFAETDGRDATATTLWSAASNISGVRPIRDPHGALAARFDAQTSGQAFVYDASGALRFRGGITRSRGHVGENDGLASVTALLAEAPGIATTCTTSPVFGCPLR